MSKPNFTVKDKETGKTYWISRAMIVIASVFKIEKNEIYTLIEKRGNSVSQSGKWCCPCGYLDWDETLEEACSREVKEETGLDIQPNMFTLVGYNSKPDKSDNENVSMRFVTFVPSGTEIEMSKIETKGEIEDLIWIKVADIKYYNYTFIKIDYESLNNKNIKWAFNHKDIIIEMLRNYYRQQNITVS